MWSPYISITPSPTIVPCVIRCLGLIMRTPVIENVITNKCCNALNLTCVLGYGEVFRSLEDFDKYIAHDGGSSYSCKMCPYRQNGIGHIRNHIESKHFPNTFTYSCSHCDKVLNSNNAFNWHKRQHK